MSKLERKNLIEEVGMGDGNESRGERDNSRGEKDRYFIASFFHAAP